MKNLKLHSCYALASAAVIGIAACSGGDGSSRFAAPTGPALDVSVSAQTGEVCKLGPVGTYNFDLVFGGSSYGSDAKSTSPVSLTVTDPSTPVCTTVFTRTSYPGGDIDPAASIQITEQAAAGTGLQSITTGGGAAPAVVDAANRRVTIYVNAFHSATTTFTNVALGGCTFTQGWYKNHTTQWPAGTYQPNTVFDGWKTWIDLYNTPPKGSQYIILAHQYMTALLNIQGGASAPQNVLDAIATATTYFNGGGAGTGGSTDISGLSGILDAYNNGITGPGHCD